MANGSIDLNKAIEAFMASPKSSAEMKLELNFFSRKCGSNCPVFLAANEVKGFMKGIKKAADRRKRAEALEAFFEFAKANGWVSANPAVGLIKKKETKIEKTAPTPKAEPILLSSSGRQQIETEMATLLEKKEKVIQEVAAAREEGDLKENAGYHDARERLALIEAQIRDREAILMRAVSGS